MLDRVQFLLTLKMGMLTLIVWGDKLNLALNWNFPKKTVYSVFGFEFLTFKNDFTYEYLI